MRWFPLVFEPVYQERIWGGRRLWDGLGRKVPFERTAESWEISAHPHGMTRVLSGPFRGKTLPELIAMDRVGLLGELMDERFPLLVKVIGAETDLSVQVHPDDAVAASIGERGKTEVWYVLRSEPGARIIYGLEPEVTREMLAEAVRHGIICSCLREVPVREGDFIPLPAGCLHALGGGIMVAEIQQSSDTTYRLYDWDRLDAQGCPRPLHIQEGLSSVKPELPLETPFTNGFNNGDILFDDAHFTVEGLCINERRTEGAGPVCRLWTVVGGRGVLEGVEACELRAGSSLLLPAAMEPAAFLGDLRILQTTPKPDRL